MANRLQGRTILVTAAAQGIGRAAALAFAREGGAVTATDINMERLSDLSATAGIATRRLDVRDGAAIAALAAELGAVDVLFNCAGFVHHGALLACTEAEWDDAFELNVKAMFRMCRAFLPAMIAAGGGTIINMASVAGAPKGVPHRCAYGASKAAVIGLTKSIAADYIADGIRCNALCPGTVQTPSLDQRIDAFDDPVQARRDFIARQPMGRLGTAEEIAGLAVYLASEEGAYATGQAFILDGGITG